jgi:hypothetical protein
MKKNLLLLGIFLALILVTYFFQEKKSEKAYVEAQTKDRLVTGEINELTLPNVKAIKKDNNWWYGEELLSHNIFKQIEKKLSEIKKIKDIEGKWESYFPNPFSFKINDVNWTIGDLSLDKQSFYIARGEEIYLAIIEGESVQLTHNAQEIAGIKLNELVSLLSTPLGKLKETQLFRFYPGLPLEKVVVEVDGNLPYELNFKEDTTSPPPIDGVTTHRDIRGKFYSLLTQANLKQEIPYSEKLKFKKLGALQFIDSKNVVKWELWLKDKASADAIIIDSDTKKAYLMIGGTLRVFFIQLQDYWDKKIIPPKEFKAFSRLDSTFIQGTKKAVVTVLNREPLEFETKGYKVEQIKMEQLFQFIFNLGPKAQAERVSNLSKSEKKQLLTEEHLRIEVMGQELILWRKAQELIVVNLTQGFKAHFNLLEENFRGTFEDVLK